MIFPPDPILFIGSGPRSRGRAADATEPTWLGRSADGRDRPSAVSGAPPPFSLAASLAGSRRPPHPRTRGHDRADWARSDGRPSRLRVAGLFPRPLAASLLRPAISVVAAPHALTSRPQHPHVAPSLTEPSDSIAGAASPPTSSAPTRFTNRARRRDSGDGSGRGGYRWVPLTEVKPTVPSPCAGVAGVGRSISRAPAARVNGSLVKPDPLTRGRAR